MCSISETFSLKTIDELLKQCCVPLPMQLYLRHAMRKPALCICKNKGADQLRGNREADQRLCFRYMGSSIPLLPKSEISSLKPSSMDVQPGSCRIWSETPKTVFSQRGSFTSHFFEYRNEPRRQNNQGFRHGPTRKYEGCYLSS